MTKKKVKKIIAAALFGVMTCSLVGTTAVVAEASPRMMADAPRAMDVRSSYGDSYEVTQLAARRHKPKRKDIRREQSRPPQSSAPWSVRSSRRIPNIQ